MVKYWFIVHNRDSLKRNPDAIWDEGLGGQLMNNIRKNDIIVYYIKKSTKKKKGTGTGWIRGIFKVNFKIMTKEEIGWTITLIPYRKKVKKRIRYAWKDKSFYPIIPKMKLFNYKRKDWHLKLWGKTVKKLDSADFQVIEKYLQK